VNTRAKIDALFWRFAPPVAAVLLIAVFISLGFWQLDRASGKIATQKLFDESAEYVPLVDGMQVKEFQRVSASGRFLAERQFLLENMISNGRLGYFAITPFEYAPDKPLLIVNRGWIAAGSDRNIRPDIPVSGDATTIRGRIGRLPRVGIHPGDALQGTDQWPKLATYPEIADLSLALGRDLLPFVLLLDPDGSQPLVREWQPREQGPMMHYGYAFQWFAMAVAVLIILAWQARKKMRHEAS
jgi:surfeit locus 1 family protein